MEKYTHTHLDRGAAVWTVTDETPTTNSTSDLVEIIHTNDSLTRKTAIAFDNGTLVVNARTFASRRASLYRMVREASRRGSK